MVFSSGGGSASGAGDGSGGIGAGDAASSSGADPDNGGTVQAMEPSTAQSLGITSINQDTTPDAFGGVSTLGFQSTVGGINSNGFVGVGAISGSASSADIATAQQMLNQPGLHTVQ